ncbi:MAG: transglycosylase SLT domain-containing protein [Anaerobutyricum hallii]
MLTALCVISFNVKSRSRPRRAAGDNAGGDNTCGSGAESGNNRRRRQRSIEDKYKVFDTMSEDWGSDDLEGFVFYDLPEKYADKGYFPEKMQIYTRCLCKQNDVPYALVLAIIEYESGYEFDKTGDNGNSKGYMQIYEKWHTDRMQKLNCIDLMNPYQNVKVGIDFLSYLLKKYGTVQDALAAYNYGERGAREHLWNNGVYVYSYNTAIMQRMKEIEEVVGK